MLLFMAYPAIKIVEYIDVKRPLSQKNKNILVVVTTILLSLIVGIFLRYY